MSTHNIGFCEEISKIISSSTFVISVDNGYQQGQHIGENTDIKNLRVVDLVRQEQARRMRHLQDMCKNVEPLRRGIIKHKPVFYFSPKYNFSFCKVTKIGSTFWTQLFAVLLKGPSFAEKIFGMNRDIIHYKLRSLSVVPYTSDVRRNSRSILVSRDPYTRLFSAFIDLLFLPLFYVPAQKMVQRQRHFPDNVTVCPSDITFQEFLDYIIYCVNERIILNGHWTPLTSVCDVCNIDAIAIVKQETFAQDVEYTLKEIGISNDDFNIIHDVLNGRSKDAIMLGLIKNMVTYNVELNSGREFCLSDLDVVKRFWKAIQIQGHLRDGVIFPSDVINNQNAMNVTLLEDVIINTIRRNPMTSDERLRQRRHALERAYQDIDVNTIKGIKDIYKQDFELFNYSLESPHAPSVIGRGTVLS